MKKIVRLGTAKTYGGRSFSIFCEIEYLDHHLSITGVEGPLQSGNCLGGCGQIVMGYLEDEKSVQSITPAPGWDHAKITKFFELWDRWHLNDLKAGCEHQRALGWDTDRIDPDKPDSYENHKGNKYPPIGHLTEACPVCGYKYGTAWHREEVPQDVIDWLFALPKTDITPAWV